VSPAACLVGPPADAVRDCRRPASRPSGLSGPGLVFSDNRAYYWKRWI